MSVDIFKESWYPEEFPEDGELVVAKIDHVDEMGIWVRLLAYGNKEAMIPVHQFTTRKGKKVTKVAKENTIVVASVTQVDKETQNMDLSRTGLDTEMAQHVLDEFDNTKKVMDKLAYIASFNNVPYHDILVEIVYPLHREFGSLLKGLKESYQKKEIIEKLNVPPKVQQDLISAVQGMFKPPEIRMHAIFEAKVASSGGVEALKKALCSGYEEVADSNIRISHVAPPLYSVAMTVIGGQDPTERIYKVLDRIKRELEAVGGVFSIKEAPKRLEDGETAAEVDDGNGRLSDFVA